MIAGLLFLLAQGGAENSYRDGVALFEKGQAAAALAPLRRATELEPKDARYWKALGVAYAAEGEYLRAEPALSKACALDRTLADACYFWARALYALDRFEGSLDALAVALPTDKRPWRIHLGMAQALEGLGRAKEAEQRFREAIAEGSRASAEPRYRYGVFLFRQGRTEEAVRPLEDNLRLFPGSAATHLELGRALLELGKVADADRHFQRALEMDPSSGQARLLLERARARQ